MKKCSICGEIKPLDEFYSQKKYSKKRGDWIYYNPECKECTKSKFTEWRKVHPKRYRENVKKSQQREEFREANRRSEKKRRESGKVSEWQRNNPDKVQSYQANKRHHKISSKEWAACKLYFNNSCAYCGLYIKEHYIRFKGETRLGDFHKEHVEHNGEDDLSNCVPSCKNCNSEKHDLDFEFWYKNRSKHYTDERYNKIIKWIVEDHKQYIKQKTS